MFRKSLVLLSMVFGLNAWGAPPDDITAAQLILMVEGNGQIQGTEEEIWVLDRNQYRRSGLIEATQDQFLAFLRGLPAEQNAGQVGFPIGTYRIHGAAALATNYTFKLRKQQ